MLCGPRFGDIANKCSTDKTFALSQAKTHLKEFAVVGIQECYSDSLSLIRKTIPWAKALQLYHENQGIPTTKIISLVDGELIMTKNEWDMEIYTYALQLFREQTETDN
eukprot:CAMPEP_0114347334 /NCGR_PEP_ID=MMETSP0101-20121206/13813_1 /TAXON_ID=38822 ORGANISM="Pteridomonas danica, Strain PT" /NCGR_SAMPLE_ID=MMETSP0101 /ASSEMBLY_ACC=CAM_ASM_000211 /LENGTH=107 /DNA_ID=CAMNT_0001484573 /DNA_START=293 /DNA_END=616 /DNA_ORIENTATION=+